MRRLLSAALGLFLSVCFIYSQDKDTLLQRWYLHRQSSSRQQAPDAGYNMDSVRFNTNVPDSVLMARLERMHSFITLPYNETVKNYMVLYSEKMPVTMGQILSLSEYYFPIFEETLDRYGLPLELKYMAVIESHLNPRAESIFGAKGLWQFMYRTGLSYGLRVNSYIDERMDPILSTDAACRYLKDAYAIFGSWPLAISAYNCGSGNVNKAIKRAGGSTDYWKVYDHLPRETRGYVPALVGAMYAINYAREYGLRPDPAAVPEYVDTFHVHRNIHLRQISEVMGIPMQDIRDLNPQYFQDYVPAAGSDEVIRLPFAYSSSFMDLQDSIARYKADTFLGGRITDGRELVNGRPLQTSTGSSWVYYKVKSGDTLSHIAKKYHCSVKQLKSWNNLKTDRISVGQRLKVGKR